MFSKRMDHKTLKLQSLEHHVHRQLKPCLKGRGFLLLAVSGGLDSMVLAQILARLRVLGLPALHIAHIHHGHLAYRTEAQEFVRNWADENRIPYHTNKLEPVTKLNSEAELRDFRYTELAKIQSQLEAEYSCKGLMLMAHHWNDQLETRLMRLIRGTGPEGFKAMRFDSNSLLRPLLENEKKELNEYAQLLGLNWIDDPSNEETNALRNWLRSDWLPALEKKQKGSVKRMALSMEKLSDAIHSESEVKKISRTEFSLLLPSEKSKILVQYLRHSGARDYSSAQVRELVKRLDTPRREHKFHLLRFEWRLNAEHIWIHQD